LFLSGFGGAGLYYYFGFDVGCDMLDLGCYFYSGFITSVLTAFGFGSLK
jgi:hypothetical protein